MYRVSLRHNFETAHRLADPAAPIKCQSIHGHSWWATVYIEGESLDEQGMLIEFGRFKKAWRGFIDDHLDHHLAVRQGDPVAAAIRAVQPEARILELPFDPTTEHMARWLFERSEAILAQLAPEQGGLRVSKLHVQETSVNAAEFEVVR